MIKGKHLSIIVGVIVILAFFNMFLASSHPDGLERVAEDKGFIEKAQDSFSVFGDYVLPIKNELLSTGLAGLLGVAVTYLLIVGLGKLLSSNTQKVG